MPIGFKNFLLSTCVAVTLIHVVYFLACCPSAGHSFKTHAVMLYIYNVVEVKIL